MPRKSKLEEKLEEVAVAGLDAMKAFLTYQGQNGDYLKKAKVGAVAVGSYTRLRATMANERQLDIIAQRIAAGPLPKALTE